MKPQTEIIAEEQADALEDHKGTVSIAGRTITSLRFADEIDGLAGDEEELAKLVERLDKDQCREDEADRKQHQ